MTASALSTWPLTVGPNHYGLNEPQGVGYEPSADILFVANARDGSVKLFEGNAYKATGQIELGGDADNIRIDTAAGRVVVGYGSGGLAMVDPSTRSKVQNVPLKAHPESFQIDTNTSRIFVNLPDAHAVVVVDGKSGKQVANWPMDKGGNFAMAVDRDRSHLLVAFRSRPSWPSSPRPTANPSRRPRPAAMSTISSSTPNVSGFTSVAEQVYRRVRDNWHDLSPHGAHPHVSGRAHVPVRAGDGSSTGRGPRRPGRAAAIWMFKPMP